MTPNNTVKCEQDYKTLMNTNKLCDYFYVGFQFLSPSNKKVEH